MVEGGQTVARVIRAWRSARFTADPVRGCAEQTRFMKAQKSDPLSSQKTKLSYCYFSFAGTLVVSSRTRLGWVVKSPSLSCAHRAVLQRQIRG